MFVKIEKCRFTKWNWHDCKVSGNKLRIKNWVIALCMQDPRMKKKTVKGGYGVAYLRGGFRLLGVMVMAIGGFCGGDGDGINDGEVFGGFLSLILSFSCFLFFFLYLFFLSPSPIYKFKINIFFYLKTLLLLFSTLSFFVFCLSNSSPLVFCPSIYRQR